MPTVSICADDTSQDVSHKPIFIIQQRLHDELVNCMNWMERNKLMINLKKTQCMLIGITQKFQNVEKCASK